MNADHIFVIFSSYDKIYIILESVIKLDLIIQNGIFALMRWLYHFNRKKLSKFKMFQICLQLHRFVAYIV